jgi:hypothetical protein
MKMMVRIDPRGGRTSEKKKEEGRSRDKTFGKKQTKAMTHLLAFLSSQEIKTKTIPTTLTNPTLLV